MTVISIFKSHVQNILKVVQHVQEEIIARQIYLIYNYTSIYFNEKEIFKGSIFNVNYIKAIVLYLCL